VAWPRFQNVNTAWSLTGLVVGLAILAPPGCRRRVADFTPAPAAAESALRRTFEAWKAGHAGGEIPGTKPLIHVTDAQRKPKQTLQRFTILGETRTRPGRTYAVELVLENPAETVRTEYVVVGIDPLWIFRREDYDLLMHWDHHMPEIAAENADSSSDL
jgi:hypothetical protein